MIMDLMQKQAEPKRPGRMGQFLKSGMFQPLEERVRGCRARVQAWRAERKAEKAGMAKEKPLREIFTKEAFWKWMADAAYRQGLFGDSLISLHARNLRDGRYRARAQDELFAAASEPKTREYALKALSLCLESEYPETQDGALKVLNKAAKDGVDIIPAIPAILKLLGRENLDMDAGDLANGTLSAAAGMEKPRASALEKIADGLSSEDIGVRRSTAFAIGSAADSMFVDITPAVPGLVKCLASDDETVRRNSSWALFVGAKTGSGLSGAAEALCECVFDSSSHVRENSLNALSAAIPQMCEDACQAIAAKMQEMRGSAKFEAGAERNSGWYIEVAGKCDSLARALCMKYEAA
jgi:hypothetical protein